MLWFVTVVARRYPEKISNRNIIYSSSLEIRKATSVISKNNKTRWHADVLRRLAVMYPNTSKYFLEKILLKKTLYSFHFTQVHVFLVVFFPIGHKIKKTKTKTIFTYFVS